MGGVARAVMPKPKAPPAPVYTAAPTKAEVSQVQATAMDSGLKRGKGRTSTILTGAKGLGDNALTTQKYTLLGG